MFEIYNLTKIKLPGLLMLVLAQTERKREW